MAFSKMEREITAPIFENHSRKKKGCLSDFHLYVLFCVSKKPEKNGFFEDRA